MIILEYDLCVVGGFGHVGLPLSIAFADKGLKVCALDINKEVYDAISSGRMPFKEEGAEELLRSALKAGTLKPSLDQSDISKSSNVLIVIGTPVGEHFSPELNVVEKLVSNMVTQLRDGQLLILRSTVFPGTTLSVERYLKSMGKKVDVAYCPERIVEGIAIKELHTIPQIVASDSKEAMAKATKLFRNITNDILDATPLEAELAKLFSNNLRYIQFSIANQFFMIANDANADFYRIKHLMTYNYPRAASLNDAGFAAGPCLFKDTVQINAFNNYNFPLGYAAISVNDGLPFYVYGKLRKKYELSKMNIGILGMAFKSDIDDKRDSLSYKLREIFKFEGKEVFCSDPYIKDESFVSSQELIDKSDIIIVATAHKEYAKLKIPEKKIVVDVWNLYKHGSRF
jgi:UDP-N-acetyl-D-mannosaminuronic acid dehydrogenase